MSTVKQQPKSTQEAFESFHGGPMPKPLATDLLHRLDAYWRAANYLSVGQIYLFDNPLLKEPLQLKHVKPRLLGHWGTTPASTSCTSTSTG